MEEDFQDADEDSTVVGEVTRFASKVVMKTAAVLEEEIAAGVSAARQVEQKLGRITRLWPGQRNGDGDDREEMDEVVATLAELVNAGARTVSTLARRVITVDASGKAAPPAKRSDQVMVPALPEAKGEPGTTVTTRLSLQNDGEEPQSLGIVETNLVSSNGRSIGSRNVRFEPDEFLIPPKGEQVIEVLIDIPQSTPAGTYRGLVQVEGLEHGRAMIILRVS